MLIAGGLLAVGVLAIIGVVLLSIERKATPEPQTIPTPSRATIPLQQMEEPESVHVVTPTPPPLEYSKAAADKSALPVDKSSLYATSSGLTDNESSSASAEEETSFVPTENEQLYEIVNQLQQLQRRVEMLERHLDMQNIMPGSFDRYEDQDASVLRTVPVALHNDSHQ